MTYAEASRLADPSYDIPRIHLGSAPPASYMASHGLGLAKTPLRPLRGKSRAKLRLGMVDYAPASKEAAMRLSRAAEHSSEYARQRRRKWYTLGESRKEASRKAQRASHWGRYQMIQAVKEDQARGHISKSNRYPGSSERGRRWSPEADTDKVFENEARSMISGEQNYVRKKRAYTVKNKHMRHQVKVDTGRFPSPKPISKSQPVAKGHLEYLDPGAPFERYTAKQQRRRSEAGAAGFQAASHAAKVGAATTALGAVAGHPLIKPIARQHVSAAERTARPLARSQSERKAIKESAKKAKGAIDLAGKHRNKMVAGTLGFGGLSYGLSAAARTRRDESAGLSEAIARSAGGKRYRRKTMSKRYGSMTEVGKKLGDVSDASVLYKIARSRSGQKTARAAYAAYVKDPEKAKQRIKTGSAVLGGAGIAGAGKHAHTVHREHSKARRLSLMSL